MLRKLKWQIPGEPLAARYNWCQGPVPGRGPAVEKHWLMESDPPLTGKNYQHFSETSINSTTEKASHSIRPVFAVNVVRNSNWALPRGVYVGRVPQSVYRLTTGWTVRWSNPGGGEIFRPSRPALGPTQPPVQWVPCLYWGQSAAGPCCWPLTPF